MSRAHPERGPVLREAAGSLSGGQLRARDFLRAARTAGGRALAAAFARAAGENRAALVGYWPAGYPDLPRSERALRAMAEGGCDVLEVGVPFSDPVADGPVLQEAAAVALKNGASLALALELAGRVRRLTGRPTVLMSYYNPLMQFGEARLAGEMARRELSGLIVPDLPVEEAPVLARPLREEGLAWVALAAPTSAGRLQRIAEQSDGFIYAVSRTGVTGMSDGLPFEALELLRALADVTDLPAALGFGIANAEQAAACRQADGVVVGTAFVEAYRRAASSGRSGDPDADVPEQAVRALAATLRQALVRPSR